MNIEGQHAAQRRAVQHERDAQMRRLGKGALIVLALVVAAWVALL